MKSATALARLGALAQESRLAVFRSLVQSGAAGMPAGDLSGTLGIAKPTLSFHLAQLEQAGLVASRRAGRSIIYAADYGAIGELVEFLYQNCCSGDPARRPKRRKP